MFDYLLDEAQKKIRDEARDFVRWVPREMVLDMDADRIRFPKAFLKEAGRRNLLGCRYPRQWGGREMDWVTACVILEEIGALGYEFACVFGVGAELVCDAIMLHGTESQKEKYVKPLLKGDMFAAECLTEPRGGSDFFGATTRAEERGDYFLLNGQKRFIVGGEGADFFLVYARTDFNPETRPQDSLTAFIVDRGPGVETTYLYGLMGCRGGGTARLVFKDVKVPRENIVDLVLSFFSFLFSFAVCLLFFCSSRLPLSFFPLSPIGSPFHFKKHLIQSFPIIHHMAQRSHMVDGPFSIH